MPESEKKEEESAESREEKKEQVSYSWKRFFPPLWNFLI